MQILYIASLNTKKNQFDGERIKSTFLYQTLSKKYSTRVINLSVFKIFGVIKMILVALFFRKKIDYIIISKDPRGANYIHRILNFVKFDFRKIIYFEIGPFLYDMTRNNKVRKDLFQKDLKIIVETSSMKKELESLSYKNVDIFPNFKPYYGNKLIIPTYPKEKFRMIYFSRIEANKGIFDLLDVMKRLELEHINIQLDIYGMFNENKEKEKFFEILKCLKNTRYCGKKTIDSKSSYEDLSLYDLHIFPTKYSEGFPGSIIDFFYAGVPTLSSLFKRSSDILDDNCAFFYNNNVNSLYNRLIFIYKNQSLLIEKRINCFKKINDYSLEKLSNYLDEIL